MFLLSLLSVRNFLSEGILFMLRSKMSVKIIGVVQCVPAEGSMKLQTVALQMQFSHHCQICLLNLCWFKWLVVFRERRRNETTDNTVSIYCAAKDWIQTKTKQFSARKRVFLIQIIPHIIATSSTFCYTVAYNSWFHVKSITH